MHLPPSQFVMIEGTLNTSLERVGIFTQKAVQCQQGKSYHVVSDDKILYIVMKRVARVTITNTNAAQHQEDE